MATGSHHANDQEPPPIPLYLPSSTLSFLNPYLPPANPQTCTLTLTYAQSLDAAISLAPGTQTLLSGPETKAMTHFLRSRHDAILIGVNTAEADDPSLNCRFAEDLPSAKQEHEHTDTNSTKRKAVGFEKQPRPIILDPSGRWTCRPSCKVLQLARSGAGKAPLWLVSAENASRVPRSKIEVLTAAGGEFVARDEFWERGQDGVGGVQWGVVLRRLWVKGIRSVMVEGGGTVIRDLLRASNREMVDAVVMTVAPVWLGAGGVGVVPEREGVAGENLGRLENVRWLQLGEDVVVAGRFRACATEEDLLL